MILRPNAKARGLDEFEEKDGIGEERLERIEEETKKLEKGSSLVEVPAAISSAIKEIAGHGKVITRVEIDGIISALN